MQRATENKIILIIRNTRLDDLIVRFNTLSQAQFYVEHLGTDFSDYLQEHQNYHATTQYAQQQLQILGRVQTVHRQFLPNFVFAPQDIVVVLGQDGLVANTLKYLDNQPVIGINPDPQRWEGVLLPFQITDLSKIIKEVFAHKRKVEKVTMAQAQLHDGQVLYAVNDLFIGQKTHHSARYLIQQGQQQEQHSSSGVIISTGMGATGWFKSLLTGAQRITQTWLGENTPIVTTDQHFAWDSDYLYFTVREPFPSVQSTANLVFGKITAQQPLHLVSQMSENGVIFSDGLENDFIEFNSGMQAEISLADKQGHLVV
jgi:NAD kinase